MNVWTKDCSGAILKSKIFHSFSQQTSANQKMRKCENCLFACKQSTNERKKNFYLFVKINIFKENLALKILIQKLILLKSDAFLP